MQISVGELKRLIKEATDDALEVGDLVDVVGDELDYASVRVVELVDDVGDATGVPHDPKDPHDRSFKGPGFVGRTPEGDELVFPVSHVVPGSKLQYHFPKLGSELESGEYSDWDEYGRDVPNPYRKMARRLATDATTPEDW